MGAVSVANRRDGVDGHGLRFVEADVTGSDDYATGGESVSLSALGLMEVEEAWVLVGAIRGLELDHGALPADNPGSSVRVDLTDRTAPLLLVYTSDGVEETATNDVSTVTFRMRFSGH